MFGAHSKSFCRIGVFYDGCYFEKAQRYHKSFIDDRLRFACNYEMNVTQLGGDKDFKAPFKGCFSPRTFAKQTEQSRASST